MSYPKFYYTGQPNRDNEHPDFKKAGEIYKLGKSIYQSDVGEAIKIYHQAEQLLPNSSFLLAKLSGAYASMNDMDTAKKYLERTLQVDPGNSLLISRIPEYYNLNGTDIIDFINDCRKFLQQKIPAVDAAMIHYGLSRLYEKLGDTTREWNNLKKHNDLMYAVTHATTPYNLYDDIITRDNIIQRTNTEIVSENTSEKPLFIVSMPRSGSTLVDQILASHSKIESLGESYNVDTLMTQLETLSHQIGDSAYTDIANEYIEALNSKYNDASYVVDKMPNNFWKIGGIKKLFPNAKIIVCMRNPLAMGLSCYKERLGGTGSWDFCNNLSDIGKFYTNIFVPLIDHWKSLYEEDIHIVEYEKLVTDFKPTINELMDFLGLNFEENLYNFHMLERGVTTISRHQVRKPLYNKLDDWKKYEKYLDDLKIGLATHTIERSCGSCNICCIETHFNTPEFSKEYMVPCEHLGPMGCSIYNKRYPICKQYKCLWLQGFGGEQDRPNLTGIISNISHVNNGTWVSVRELTPNAISTTGKNMVLDLVKRHNIPVIVREYNSDRQEGNIVIIKQSLMPRSSKLISKFVGWLDTNIGIYELNVHK